MIVIDKLQKVAAARGLSFVDAVQLEVGGDTVAALRARGRHSGSSPWLTFESGWIFCECKVTTASTRQNSSPKSQKLLINFQNSGHNITKLSFYDTYWACYKMCTTANGLFFFKKKHA